MNSVVECVFTVAQKTVGMVLSQIQQHRSIFGTYAYPDRFFPYDFEMKDYEVIKNSIPFLRYDIPKYFNELGSEGSYDFYSLFLNNTNDYVDCTKTDEFADLVALFEENEAWLVRICDNKEKLAFRIQWLINHIVIRYLSIVQIAGEKDSVSILRECTEKFLNRIINDNLEYEIFIPLNFITFCSDMIMLDGCTEIVRMSNDIQKARQHHIMQEPIFNNWVQSCATHMLVVKKRYIKNRTRSSVEDETKNVEESVLQTALDILGIIRTITGEPVGISQVLMHPVDWFDRTYADLFPLYPVSCKQYLPCLSSASWMDLPVAEMVDSDIGLLEELYKASQQVRKNKKNNLLFAMKRLNRCMERDKEDDMLTDAIIGLEALLTHDARGGISDSLARRFAVIYALSNDHKYEVRNCRKILKEIYSYRSEIVHGKKKKNTSGCVQGCTGDIPFREAAVDFLRIAIGFLLCHQEYLELPKLEDLIDEAIFMLRKPNALPHKGAT